MASNRTGTQVGSAQFQLSLPGFGPSRRLAKNIVILLSDLVLAGYLYYRARHSK